jgi:hypothetical protein
MKKITIFILFVVACSCKQAVKETNHKVLIQTYDNPIHTNSYENENLYESIDTVEFVVYWGQFRKAILEHDMINLVAMVNDSIDGGWFLRRDYKKHTDKLDKRLFLENLYVLFTPEFLSLLKTYEINKFLRSNSENILWKKKEKKTYQSYVHFYYKQIELKGDYHKIANYQMRCVRDRDDSEDYVTKIDNFVENDYLFVEWDIGRTDYIAFDLNFIKIASEIKLYSVGFSYNYSISD